MKEVSSFSTEIKVCIVAGNENMKQVSASLTETKSIGIVAENEKSRHRRWKRNISQVARENEPASYARNSEIRFIVAEMKD